MRNFPSFTNELDKAWNERPDKRAGTRKIADAPMPCRHPEHEPAKFMVYKPGTYEHVCPACKKRVVFTVPLVFC